MLAPVTGPGPVMQSYSYPDRIFFYYPVPDPTRRILPGTRVRFGSGTEYPAGLHDTNVNDSSLKMLIFSLRLKMSRVSLGDSILPTTKNSSTKKEINGRCNLWKKRQLLLFVFFQEAKFALDRARYESKYDVKLVNTKKGDHQFEVVKEKSQRSEKRLK